jgi:hypothetical protein
LASGGLVLYNSGMSVQPFAARCRLGTFLLAALALPLHVPLWADEPADRPGPGGGDVSVAGLIAQLGAEELGDREQAERLLVELGVTALEALDSARSSDHIEIRLRATQVAQEINRRRMSQAEVHVVGLYESGTRDGRVAVRIAAASKPVVLVVCARDAVTWQVEVAEEVELLRVIASGHHPQQVSAGDVEVEHLSSEGDHPREVKEKAFYAYRKGILYDEMVERVKELTGQDVQTFQGRYDSEGQPFVIGAGR